MENVILCHLCVTQWIYRTVKAVLSPNTIHTSGTDFSLLLLYSAVLALLQGPDTFFCPFVAAALWLLQGDSSTPQKSCPISNSKHIAAFLQINRQIIRSLTERSITASDRITVASGTASGFTLCLKAAGDVTENLNPKI